MGCGDSTGLTSYRVLNDRRELVPLGRPSLPPVPSGRRFCKRWSSMSPSQLSELTRPLAVAAWSPVMTRMIKDFMIGTTFCGVPSTLSTLAIVTAHPAEDVHNHGRKLKSDGPLVAKTLSISCHPCIKQTGFSTRSDRRGQIPFCVGNSTRW